MFTRRSPVKRRSDVRLTARAGAALAVTDEELFDFFDRFCLVLLNRIKYPAKALGVIGYPIPGSKGNSAAVAICVDELVSLPAAIEARLGLAESPVAAELGELLERVGGDGFTVSMRTFLTAAADTMERLLACGSGGGRARRFYSFVTGGSGERIVTMRAMKQFILRARVRLENMPGCPELFSTDEATVKRVLRELRAGGLPRCRADYEKLPVELVDEVLGPAPVSALKTARSLEPVETKEKRKTVKLSKVPTGGLTSKAGNSTLIGEVKRLVGSKMIDMSYGSPLHQYFTRHIRYPATKKTGLFGTGREGQPPYGVDLPTLHELIAEIGDDFIPTFSRTLSAHFGKDTFANPEKLSMAGVNGIDLSNQDLDRTELLFLVQVLEANTTQFWLEKGLKTPQPAFRRFVIRGNPVADLPADELEGLRMTLAAFQGLDMNAIRFL